MGKQCGKPVLWSKNGYISRVVVIPPFAESKCRKIVVCNLWVSCHAVCFLDSPWKAENAHASNYIVHSIEGAERYEDRGIIPRTIAYVFEAICCEM